MILHKTQIEVAKDTHRFRVLCCGRRWGKTSLAVEEIKGFAIFKESKIAYFATTHGQARDLAWNILLKELEARIVSKNETRLELVIRNNLGTESTIVLRGWESVDTIRGLSFDFLVLDEVSSMRNFWSNWNDTLSPTLTDRKGQALFISTPKGYNHFYELFNMELKEDSYKSFKYSTYDNPYIPVEELERERKIKPEHSFAQEYLASFQKTEGLVYKEFKRDVHIREMNEKEEAIVYRIAGVDFGYNHPTAITYITKTNRDNFYVTKEYYKSGKINQDIINELKQNTLNQIFPDPAEPDRIEEMRRAGLPVKEVNKDVEKGIDTVRTLLVDRKLFVSKDCINLINEFESYIYEENRDLTLKEKVVKENDDALDSLRYALFNFNPIFKHNESASFYNPMIKRI